MTSERASGDPVPQGIRVSADDQKSLLIPGFRAWGKENELVINFLGMAEYVVDEVEETDQDFLVRVHVAGEAVCPNCGSTGSDLVGKGTRERGPIMHSPRDGKRVGIEVQVRRFRCKTCGKIASEALPGVAPRKRITNRLVSYIETHCFNRPFQWLADEVGVDEGTVRTIFEEAAERRERNRVVFPKPRVLGIDEVHLSGGSRFVAANIGLKPATVIDLLESRKKEDLLRYFQSVNWKDKVGVIAMDLHRPYREVANAIWPDAVVVIDKFHVVQEATRAVEEVRALVTEGAGPELRRFLGPGHNILRKRKQNLEELELEWLARCETRAPSVVKAFNIKEGLFRFYDAKARKEAETRLGAWESSIPGELDASFRKLKGRLTDAREEILAYFDVGVTNAGTEALNGLIKLTRRLSPALSFRGLRAKILFGSRQARGGFWENAANATPLQHGMGYSTGGGSVRPVVPAETVEEIGNGTAGTDLERLVMEMNHRVGDWEDARLWVP